MVDTLGPLLEPRCANDAQLFALLQTIIERKLVFDGTSGSEPFDDNLIEYGSYPEGKPHFLEQLLASARYGFPLVTEARAINELDRRASLVSGPFYTNAEFPWLGEAGHILEPLLQVDLDWASKVGGVDLGSGLLQVWSNFPETIIREIPRSSVSEHDPEPVPAWAGDLGNADLEDWFSLDTRECGKATWTEHGHQIISVGEKSRDLHQAIRRILETEVLDRADEYDRPLVSDAEKALDLISCPSSRPVSSTVQGQLFGNCHPWNWDADLSPVLVNLESDYVLHFKEEGQGTLYYSQNHPPQEFRFEWGL